MLQQAEKSSSNLKKKSSLSNLIFQTGEFQKSNADKNSYEINFENFQEEPIGTQVIQVFASYEDDKTNGEVTYSIGNIGCGV